MKSAHPPVCPYPSCDGRTFGSQKGLRGHLKVHEDREIEDQLREDADDEADGGDAENETPAKRRRGGEIGRDWRCSEEACGKAFKSVCPPRSARSFHLLIGKPFIDRTRH